MMSARGVRAFDGRCVFAAATVVAMVLVIATLVGCAGEGRQAPAQAVGDGAGGPSSDQAAGMGATRESDEDEVNWTELNGPGDQDPADAPETPFSVDPESDTCDLDLPFHPPGCACTIGEKAKCWTGPPGLRGLPGCQDGEQECVGTEFGNWGDCEGLVLDCMVPEEEEEDPPPPPEQECGCVPGTVITCSEDCSQLIICSLTGTKVCQPDGTWSACREGDFAALEQAKFCRSMFYGCFPNNSPGVFFGDCGPAFTCGEVPPALSIDPPPEVPPVAQSSSDVQ